MQYCGCVMSCCSRRENKIKTGFFCCAQIRGLFKRDSYNTSTVANTCYLYCEEPWADQTTPPYQATTPTPDMMLLGGRHTYRAETTQWTHEPGPGLSWPRAFHWPSESSLSSRTYLAPDGNTHSHSNGPVPSATHRKNTQGSTRWKHVYMFMDGCTFFRWSTKIHLLLEKLTGPHSLKGLFEGSDLGLGLG